MTDHPKPDDRGSTEEYDATGTARYADAREDVPVDPATAGPAEAAVGFTGHMGESATSPGLAGDLSEVEADEPGEDSAG